MKNRFFAITILLAAAFLLVSACTKQRNSLEDTNFDRSVAGSLTFDVHRSCACSFDGVDLSSQTEQNRCFIKITKTIEEDIVFSFLLEKEGEEMQIETGAVSVTGDSASIAFDDNTQLSITRNYSGETEQYPARVCGWIKNEGMERLLSKGTGGFPITCDISITWTSGDEEHDMIVNFISGY